MVLGMTYTVQDLRSPETLRRENRTLLWQVKQLGKQLGKQGDTIFRLRNEAAALRLASLLTPGDYHRMLTQLRESQAETQRLRVDNRRLRDRLTVEKVQVGDNLYAQTQGQADALNHFIETGE